MVEIVVPMEKFNAHSATLKDTGFGIIGIGGTQQVGKDEPNTDTWKCGLGFDTTSIPDGVNVLKIELTIQFATVTQTSGSANLGFYSGEEIFGTDGLTTDDWNDETDPFAFDGAKLSEPISQGVPHTVLLDARSAGTFVAFTDVFVTPETPINGSLDYLLVVDQDNTFLTIRYQEKHPNKLVANTLGG